MSAFTIDVHTCKRDEICVEECPAKVIQMKSADDFPTPVDDFDTFCLRCGHCVAVCPSGAFSLTWLKPEDCLPIKKSSAVSDEQAEQFLRARRSVRTFKKKRLDRTTLEKLLKIGGYAASAKNEQPWHWMVIEDPEEVQRLVGMVIEWMQVVIKQDRVNAGRRGFPRIVTAWAMGKDRVCRGAPHLIVVHADRAWPFGSEDCACALTYLDLYAHAIGLGTCWGGYFYTAANNYAPLFEDLGIPGNHRLCGAMMVGHSKYTYHRCPPRNQPRVRWK